MSNSENSSISKSSIYLPRDQLVDQFGFRATGSTTCALIDITHVVSQLSENNKYVRCLMIDFTKAFDTIDHLLLLKKVGAFGLPSLVVKRVVDFLTGRSRATKRGQSLSKWLIINRSIIQGSGFGPMFLLSMQQT